jgi:hypothetical protein
MSAGQRNPKYENVVKRASELSPEEAFGLYSDFLSLNPAIERSNPYFQPAELASAMMKKLDPMTNYREIKKIYTESGRYYSLCTKYLSDNDVRKDQALYSAVHSSQKRLTANDVAGYIRIKQYNDSLFFNEITSVFETFSAMIASYYHCMDAYKKIAQTNRNLNDIYINWDDNKALLNFILHNFDSVVHFKAALSDKTMNMNFVFNTINTFKIDGFTPSRFQNTVELWDYKSWAVRQIVFYEETLLPVINNAADVENSLNLHIDNINKSRKPAPDKVHIKDKLTEQLKKMQDITPLYSKIEYKKRIIDFLNLAYDERNVPATDAYSVNDQSAYIYSLMESHNRVAGMAKEMATNYPSIKKDAQETELIAHLYSRSIDNYKQYIINAENSLRSNNHINYNKTKIPKYKSSGFYRPTNAGYIVKNIIKNDAGNLILSGASVNAQGFAVAFTAFSADTQNISWLRTVDLSKLIYDDCTVAVGNMPSGVISLVCSKNVSDPLLTTHTVVKYDMKGNEKQKITLANKNLPLGRFMFYDEISESTLLAFYGDTENWYQDTAKLILQHISKDGNLIFNSEIRLNGELINLFPAGNGQFILFGNYISLDTAKGNATASPGIFSMMIDKTGKTVKTSLYPSNKPRYGIHVSRVSPDAFLIAGTGGSAPQNPAAPLPSDGEPVLILTNSEGDFLMNYELLSSN